MGSLSDLLCAYSVDAKAYKLETFQLERGTALSLGASIGLPFTKYYLVYYMV